MKITAVDAFVCPPQWTFVRIRTDEGITGWGEAGMQFRARAVQAAVHDLRGYLIGEDPTRIEAHWQVIRRSSFLRGGPILSSAQAAVDIALWDIVGKLHGVPDPRVARRPGARPRPRLRLDRGRRPLRLLGAGDRRRDDAVGRAGVHGVQADTAQGLRRRPAVSWAGDRRPARPRCARRSVPTGTSHSTSTATGRRRWRGACVARSSRSTCSSSRSRCSPRTSTSSASSPRARRSRSQQVSACTRRWDFADLVQSGVAVLQPDVSQAGGISELRRIAALAETYDVTVAPHCPLGPVTLAASLQIDFATPNILDPGAGHHLLRRRLPPLRQEPGGLRLPRRALGASHRARPRSRDRREGRRGDGRDRPRPQAADLVAHRRLVRGVLGGWASARRKLADDKTRSSSCCRCRPAAAPQSSSPEH